MLYGLATVPLLLSPVTACTNLLIPSGSSTDGSTILAYNADSSYHVGALAHWPAQQHEPGELRPTWDWESNAYLGAIPQPPVTYNVVGSTNEHQLSITETTFGGLELLDATGGRAECHQVYGCLDYGQLLWVTLARAKTARAAIDIIDSLMQTYGYASTGESFSIADTKEVWLMEIIGKGNISKGAVWVATRIPDSSVCAHANQARTRAFLPHDLEHFRHSPDVVSFARELGLFSGEDVAFSFSDIYDPVTVFSARSCEARVFSFFANVAASHERIEDYRDYVEGRNLANRMPLYVQVKQKISVNDTMWHMRNHYEETWMDPTSDVGAGEWRSPIRLGFDAHVWQSGGNAYINERPISVPYTMWNLVAVQRPQHRFGVLWFGMDDSAFTVRAPFYGAASRVPMSWDDANCTQRDACREELALPGTMTKFSFQSMFWVCNLVANYAYSRYDQIAPAVYERIVKIEARLQKAVERQDEVLSELAATGASDVAVAEAATAFSYKEAAQLHQEWLDFYGELFATFVDGYRLEPLKKEAASDFGFRKHVFGFRDLWKKQIATTTGDLYVLPTTGNSGSTSLAALPKDKRCLRAFGSGPGHCFSAEEGHSGVETDISTGSTTILAASVASAMVAAVMVAVRRMTGRRLVKTHTLLG